MSEDIGGSAAVTVVSEDEIGAACRWRCQAGTDGDPDPTNS